jgi:peptide chain release factor 1
MTPKEIEGHAKRLEERRAEVEKLLSDPAAYSDQEKSTALSKELRRIDSFLASHGEWTALLEELDSNRGMLENESDPEFAELLASEIETAEKRADELEKLVLAALLPPDPDGSRNIIVEVKPAAGGGEAALFAGELYRAYCHYADKKGWKRETLDLTESDLGGIRDAMFSLRGEEVFSRMKHECGVHRVQRVPVTESGGRIHTSTVTVAVIPEAKEIEFNVNQEDLRIDVFRASGPGGQCVNTTDSAVRITHLPTGTVVVSQQEKSQHRNKEIAMRILRARLFERKRAEEAEKAAANKRAQVGTGDRSERIRTYNFARNSVADHKHGVTIHNLPKFLEGEMDTLLDAIAAVECERALGLLAEKADAGQD